VLSPKKTGSEATLTYLHNLFVTLSGFSSNEVYGDLDRFADAPALVNVEMSGSEFSCLSCVVFSAMNMKLPWKQLRTLYLISPSETIAIIRRCPHLSICFLVSMYEVELRADYAAIESCR
jgi:hypothetical protein